MTKSLRQQALAALLIAPVFSALLPPMVAASTLEGRVEATSASGTVQDNSLQGRLDGSAKRANLSTGTTQLLLPAGANTLQGGLRDNAQLQSSIKVLPKQSPQSRATSLGSSLQDQGGPVQFKGAARSGPRAGQSLAPLIAPRSSFGVIAPITTYRSTPRNGVMTFEPELTTTPSPDEPQIESWSGARSSENQLRKAPKPGGTIGYVQSRHGVSFWGFSEDQFLAGSGVGQGEKDPACKKGVTCWSSQYETRITAEEPTPFPTVTTSNKNIGVWKPGATLASTMSHRGVTCWSPGYEVSITLPPDVVGNTIGGVWSAGGALQKNTSTSANLASRHTNGRLFRPTIPITATALLAPELQATLPGNLTWSDWYKKVAQAVYRRWSLSDVGPGSGVVLVRVTSGRKISGQLTNFTPLAQNDSSFEQNFREAALRSVNLVNSWEIPPLPQGRFAVEFELEMVRATDHPPGVELASQH